MPIFRYYGVELHTFLASPSVSRIMHAIFNFHVSAQFSCERCPSTILVVPTCELGFHSLLCHGSADARACRAEDGRGRHRCGVRSVVRWVGATERKVSLATYIEFCSMLCCPLGLSWSLCWCGTDNLLKTGSFSLRPPLAHGEVLT